MDRSDPEIPVEMRMKNSDITEAYYPFWFCFELLPVQFVYDPHYTVTASCAHDRFNFRVIQHLLKIFGPFVISAAKGEIPLINCIAYFDFIAPAFHLFYRGLNFLGEYITCRCRDPDNISGF